MKSGILFPLSSFPSKHGIGDLGKEAYKVIDQLAANKGQYLQILPFHPSTQANSPYRAVSTYAGDGIYINLNSLVELIKVMIGHHGRLNLKIILNIIR